MSSIYLISPPKVNLSDLSIQLEQALSTKKVPIFQLRLKNISQNEILNIGKVLIEICHKYNTKFILNDDLELALEIGSDGVHLGAKDGNLINIRSITPKDFIIGVSCYDSKDRALAAKDCGADYVSFGTFFPSKTKNSIGKPNIEILKWCKDELKIPSCAIGGITNDNCQELIKNGADYLAVISYIWQHEKGVEYAVNSLI